jgi:hypothetical protein
MYREEFVHCDVKAKDKSFGIVGFSVRYVRYILRVPDSVFLLFSHR